MVYFSRHGAFCLVLSYLSPELPCPPRLLPTPEHCIPSAQRGILNAKQALYHSVAIAALLFYEDGAYFAIPVAYLPRCISFLLRTKLSADRDAAHHSIGLIVAFDSPRGCMLVFVVAISPVRFPRQMHQIGWVAAACTFPDAELPQTLPCPNIPSLVLLRWW